MLKVIVAGGREFSDYHKLQAKLNLYLRNQAPSDIEIVSGGASGADELGERYANDYGYDLKVFPADWSLGKKAGPIRNKQMAEYADGLVAFDTGGRGTANMIGVARDFGLKVRVVDCKKTN